MTLALRIITRLTLLVTSTKRHCIQNHVIAAIEKAFTCPEGDFGIVINCAGETRYGQDDKVCCLVFMKHFNYDVYICSCVLQLSYLGI